MEREPFPIRGVVEGFYGTFYTFPERNDLLQWLGSHGFNFYMYGPKNDRQHRMRWWDPYPPAILGDFAQSIRIAQEAGITFCYAISFGVPLNYASTEDFTCITDKLQAFFDRGCRSFGVLLDDMETGFAHDVNRKNFKNVAEAHADCCNRLADWLHSRDEVCKLYLCPTEYFGVPPFTAYLHDLGALLDPAIELFYSGPVICPKEILAAEVAAFAEVVHRSPLLWDNYPANDLQMRKEMHIGPLLGRDPLLPQLCRGYVANLMNQKEASKIALGTIADYLRNPRGYDPAASWEGSLREAVDEESYTALRRFAENSLGSCVHAEEAPEMSRLITAALAALRRGESPSGSEAVIALSAYFDSVDESGYELKNRMRNLALRQNLLPWIEGLEDRSWMGRGALRVLQAIEAGNDYSAPLQFMESLADEIQLQPRRMGSTLLVELVEYARARAASGSASAPLSPATVELDAVREESTPQGVQGPAENRSSTACTPRSN